MNYRPEHWHTAHVIARALDAWWAVSPHWEHTAFWCALVYTFFAAVGFLVNMFLLIFGIHRSWNPIALFITGIDLFVVLFVARATYRFITDK
jgi:hypothetical protein